MNKTKRLLGIILVLCLLLTTFQFQTFAAVLVKAGGWNETIYAEWQDSAPENAVVEYKKSTDSAYTKADAQLIRTAANGNARADIPGVSAGSYDIKITASDGTTLTSENIEVKAYDRSGYAHFNYTRGVGAYTDEGVLKANAKVVYVTEENKDTVELAFPNDPTHVVTGIGNILNSRGAVGSSEGATNTNDGILLAYSNAGIPLDFRFIGTVTSPENGLTAFDSPDYGGTKKDNGHMARMKDAKDITIEGIGTDAVIEGWGIHFMASSAYLEYGESFEVRNLTFDKYPEDALGMEGIQTDNTLTAPVERCWIHNCSFMPGYCPDAVESDKTEGDGSCDFKRGQYYTMSYCYYYGCHKTNLIGASDSNYQFHLTFHHNWWQNCESRGPLLRRANMHIYNCYYQGNVSKTMDTRANSYTLSEANYFDSCKNPITTKSGSAVKSYGDVFYNCSGSQMGTVVTDREAVVSNSTTYSDFDTNPSVFYYNSLTKESDCYKTNAITAKAECIAYSGVMKDEYTEPVVEPVITAQPANSISYPYSINFTPEDAGVRMTAAGVTTLKGTNIELENVLYSSTSDYKPTTTTGLKSKGLGVIVFKLDMPSMITINCADSGKYGISLIDSYGLTYAQTEVGGTASANVPAGIYAIQPTLSEKEAYIAGFEISAPGEIENPTEATTEAVIVENGTYNIGTAQTGENDCTEENGVFGGISYDLNSISDNYGTINDGDSEISFSVDRTVSLTLTTSDNPVVVSALSGKVDDESSVTLQPGTNTVKLYAGIYTISGESSSDAKVYTIVIDDYTEPATESTETTTETTTYSIPVEAGTPKDDENTDSSCYVRDNGNGTYTLIDGSSSVSTKWRVPFEEQKTGKIVIKGEGATNKQAGKWAFVQIRGQNSASTDGEICALSSDSSKNLALKYGDGLYVSSEISQGNTNYSYEFIIDLDAKTASLTANGSLIGEHSIDVESISSVFFITANAATDRTVTATIPYIGILVEAPDESSTESSTELTTEDSTESSTEPTTEDSTESSTELTTEDSTESSTEPTTEPPSPQALKGDVDGNNILTANDASALLSFILQNEVKKDFWNTDLATADVNNDGLLLSSDAALILVKVLNSSKGF